MIRLCRLCPIRPGCQPGRLVSVLMKLGVVVDREICKLRFDGPTLSSHEMELEKLANSLLAFKTTIEQANVLANGKNSLISIKVKGGFQEGSLLTDIVVDYIGPIVPVCTDILKNVTQVLALKKMLKGDPPQQETPIGDSLIQITNSEGTTINVNTLVVQMHNSAPVSTSIGKIADGLGEGVTSIGVETGPNPEDQVTLLEGDKAALQPSVEDQVEEHVRVCDLEILTSQNDGKQAGWRFYDEENDVEFIASVADNNFLTDVSDRKYNFQHGDRIKVNLKETKKFINSRKRTTRTVLEVISYTRP